MKKLLSLILVFVLLLTMLHCSFVAFADETVHVEGHYKYTVSNGEATIVDVMQSLGGDITVPTELGEYPVVALGEHAFTGFDTITSITIGGEIRTIGPSAFTSCDKLETVILGDSVTIIEDYAFIDCINLKSINIPKNLKTIGSEVLVGCVSLCQIDVSLENENFSSVDGILFDKNQKMLIKYPEGKTETSYTIPETVETVGFYAFRKCENLTNVSIPNSVKTIEYGAFAWCYNLESVTIPDSVTQLSDSAFYNCYSLLHVNLGNGIKSIGADVFYGCGFSDIKIPETVEWIGVCAFMHCANLTNLTIPENVESIAQGAFMFCWELKTVQLPKSLIRIREDAFAECRNITNVYYTGTKPDMDSVYIGKDNQQLENAVWHYGTERHGLYSRETTTAKKATFSNHGEKITKCSVCDSVFETERIPKINIVKMASKVTYTGKKKEPTVTVENAHENRLKKDIDYTVTYSGSRKKFGKYKVTVNFMGDYSGKKVLYFQIVPKGIKISKLTAQKKSLKVKFKKQRKNISGYQIEYSLKKNFKSSKKVTVKKSYTTKTIKKLKSKKTYYVRIRTYKTYKGKKYYSSWSSVKKKKTK